VRFFFRQRLGWPTVGIALAAGLVVADCLFVVGPYMGPFNAGSLWPILVGALGMYALLGVGIDLAVQLLTPGAARRSIWIRGGAVLAVGIGLTLAAGEARSLPLLAVAALFALLALGRFSWPLAAVAAAIALYSSIKSPSLPEGNPEGAPIQATAAPLAKPSFVVVVLDTVRADHTSAYGYHRDTTPNLARLSERGIRFEHGYETANFTGNAWIGPGTGMTRGFQLNHASWRSYHVDLMLLAKRVYYALMAPDWDKGGAETVAAIRHWLGERGRTRPYFLFVNFYEPHAPYQHVPRVFRGRFTDAELSLHALEAIGTRVTTATQNGQLLSAGDVAAGRASGRPRSTTSTPAREPW
jgi:hypothetical protein